LTRSLLGGISGDLYSGYRPAGVIVESEDSLASRLAYEGSGVKSGVKVERSRLWHLFARELASTARSVKAGGTPATVLHALMQEGPLAAGEIAGIVHSDPRDNDVTLSTLIELGVVEVDDSRPMPRYFITGTLD
jgi:hypothetical protein